MLYIEPVTTQAELNDVYRIRKMMYETRSPHVNLDDEFDALQDEYSTIMLLKARAEPIATVRATPVMANMTLLERLNLLPSDLVRRKDLVEVSRLAAIPGRLDDVPYSLIVLAAGAQYLLNRSDYRYFFAYCRSSLCRLYQLVGAKKRGLSFTINGYGDIKFTLVEGSLSLAATVVSSSLQWEMSEERLSLPTLTHV